MDTESIKQLAVDVNNVALASFQSGKESIEKPLLAKIAELEVELDREKKFRKNYEERSRCYVRTIEAELEKHRWIPVSERLPNNGGSRLLAYGKDGFGYKIVAATSYDEEFEKFRINLE